MSTPQIDLDTFIDTRTSERTPEFRLWLMVTIRAFETLRCRWGHYEMARSWFEDQENYFFNSISEEMGFSPEAMRERIRKALARTASQAGPGGAIRHRNG
jgi:hypothetical protein